MTEMDGLRGLAALTVFNQHALSFLPGGQPPGLSWFSNGTIAVDLFFVLSGFVLALPYTGTGNKKLDYPDFLVRRVFRLYPAYWVAMFLTLAMQHWYVAPIPGLNPAIQSFLATHATRIDVLRHLTLIGRGIDFDRLIPVAWSLLLEMRVSLFFPLLVVLMRNRSLAVQAAVWVVATAIGLRLSVFFFVPFFLLGILISSNLDFLRSAVARIPWPGKVAGFALAIFLYEGASLSTRDYRHLTAELGSAMFILLLAGSPAAAAALSVKPVRFLGEISYSFYLLHFGFTLLTFSVLFPPTSSFALCWAVSFALTCAVSWLVFQYVELPMQRVGKTVLPALRRTTTG